ncbi:MAG: hypothetical protein ABIK23_01050 [candidate division WOR-3 bacterium]
MKGVIVFYSLTGNNEAVAKGVAQELGLNHIKITEGKRRRALSTLIDIIFNRTPETEPEPEVLKGYDLILFFAPVWIGHIATPLRKYLEYIKENRVRFGFVSICGGANPGIRKELKRRAGTEPEVFLEFHITDLLPEGTKPTIKTLTTYRLTENDVKRFKEAVVQSLRKCI